MEHIINNYISRIQQQTAQQVYETDGLFGGALAAVWVSFHQWRATRQQHYKIQTQEGIGLVFEHLNSGEPRLYGGALSSGIAGFCYVTTILQKDGIINLSLDDNLSELDDFLYEWALEEIEKRHLDFWHGAFGVIFYFLERLNTPKVKTYTEVLINAAIGEIEGNNETLWFPNVSNPESDAIINLGLSHGQSAFIIVLIQAANNGIATDHIRPVVQRCLKFMLNQQKSPDFEKNFSLFPLSINYKTNTPNYKNRLAICYGDLNVVLMMYHAAQFFDDSDLKRRADIIGLSTLQRKKEVETMVSDAHFCHGAAGVAQLYRTFYEITGLEGYKRGYEEWIDKTLAYADKDLETNAYEGSKGSIVSGWLGVELVLLHYVSKERLEWDRLFLLGSL